MLRTIVTYPAEVLRGKAKDVENIDSPLIQLAQDMAETMYLSRGIGLAAPQVGEPLNLIVVDIGDRLIELYNPQIVSAENFYLAQEGCLSVPEVMLEVERAEKVVVKGLDRNGKAIELEAQDLLARVLQHEIDHLQGTLIIDRISRIQRQLILGKLKKLRREHET
jgi:peptide deformylase